VSPGDQPFHIGRPAPSLVVPQVGGGTIDLSVLRGKPVWVNFMGTYCPPCRDEFPLMNGFYVRYAEAGLIVLAIDVREEEGTVAAFAQELNATFPLGLDADGSAQRAWEAIVLPVHFWVDAEGIVRDGALGGIGPDIMAAGLRTIMPGVDVTP
jgi:thiol-disulfide isomerase/thioredoxin